MGQQSEQKGAQHTSLGSPCVQCGDAGCVAANPHLFLKDYLFSPRLWGCNLSEESCADLASVLSSNSSTLRDLNLSDNKLQDSGVKLLSAGLKSSHCKLEKLGLAVCNLTEKSCAVLAAALSSNSSTLRDLNLSYNDLQDIGVELLSAGMKNPHCKLEKLELINCSITGEGCATLASALKSNPSHLRELDLISELLSLKHTHTHTIVHLQCFRVGCKLTC
uniref:SPRY-associated domain-containing protein n=1 Tax=Astyanax mexicanus TaxID=7994 RepID=W5KHI3_ASTMX